MSYHVGQQVVCVGNNFSWDETWRWAVRTFPQVGSIYTIREVRFVEDVVGLCFYEFANPHALFHRGAGDFIYVEPAFHTRNFRPVKKTSIEVLEKLLAPLDSADPPGRELVLTVPGSRT